MQENNEKHDAMDYIGLFVLVLLFIAIGSWAVRSFLFAEFAPMFDVPGRIMIFLSFSFSLRAILKVVDEDDNGK